MRRIADAGIRYSNFHTTALCSPTRSSLLTGRNATSNNMACITEGAAGFPGFSARIPFENGTIAEVLNERGWNTYAIGKWHLTPARRVRHVGVEGRAGRSAAGFERFYGFLGGETNQWYPDLVYDNHRSSRPTPPEEGYHLSKDLADKGDPVRPRRQGGRPRQALVHVLLPGRRPRAAPRRSRSGRTGTRAASTQGYEAIRADDPGEPEGARACCPTTSSCRRSTRTASRGDRAATASRGRSSTSCDPGTR